MHITCVSDIHLNCFKTHNFVPGFRDEQYLRAADRTIEISRSKDSKVLCILGDLIDSPIITPRASHLLVSYVEKLSSYYDKIYYILGQHDQDSKLLDWDPEDTVITLLSKICPKMEYVDKKVVDIGGRKVYFRDWTPREIINDVPECDMFFGHVTLDPMYGQKIDPIKYKLGIFGDIHSVVDMGVDHSVGGYLQKNLSDAPYGKVVLIDLDTLKFERVNLIDETHHFLRIYNEGTEENPDEYTIINKKNHKINSIVLSDFKDEAPVELDKLDKVLKDKLSKLDLLDIHAEVMPKCKITPPLNFDFQLKKLIVDNFRSIEHFEFDLNKYNGIVFISGANGSGKTSLISALYTALVGDRFINRDVKLGKDHVRLELDLSYEGIDYKIVRGSGLCEFYINGERVSKNNKSALEGYIAETLPFIPYLSVFYVKAKSNYFTNLFNSKLINKLFGIDNFVQYNKVSVQNLKLLTKDYQVTENDISTYSGKLSVLKNNETVLSKKLEDLLSKFNPDDEKYIHSINSIINLRNSIEQNKYRLGQLNADNVEVSEYESLIDSEKKLNEALNTNRRIDELTRKINNYKSESESIKNSKKSLTCPHCNKEIVLNLDSIKVRLENIAQEMLVIKLELDSLNRYTDDQIAKLRSDYNRFNELSRIKSIISEKNSLTERISSQESELANLITDDFFNKSNDDLLNWKAQFLSDKTNLESAKRDLESCRSQIISTQSTIDELTDKNSKLADKINKYKIYSELFDEKSPNSIHKEVMVRISESLSDDEVSFTNQNTDEDNLGLQLLVNDKWIDYSRCSTGQQSYLDLKLINKLFTLIGKTGLLILDEIVANVDSSHIENCLEIIRGVPTNNLLMISHNTILNNDFNNKLSCELVNGCSVFS